MKKVLMILFLIISSLSFGEWEIGYSDEITTVIESSEQRLKIWCDRDGVGEISFILEEEELKKIEPTFNAKEIRALNKLPFIDKAKVLLKVDRNEKITMGIYKSDTSGKIFLSLTSEKDKENVIEIGKQMVDGKWLKVTFIKGKNKIEKYIDLKGFKEKYKEVEKTYN